MKLTFKDLKQQKFVIEAEPTELISAVKEKIHAEKGWDPSLQKLIYSGKILQDTNTVESYNIEEKGFIVCMVSKPKAAPAPKPVPATPVSAPTAQTPAAPAQSVPSNVPAQVPATPTPARTTDAASNAPRDPNALAMGQERAEAIENLVNMGFERSQVELAMRAAFFNAERAAEYLMDGIPPAILAERAQPAAPGVAPPAPASAASAMQVDSDEPVNLFEAAAQAGRSGRGGAGAGGPGGLVAATGGAAGGGAGAGALGNLDWLRSNQQFLQLRGVIQQQPQMLEPILQSLANANPDMARLIGEHPEEFLQLLSEDNDGDMPLPPGAQSIAVTEEENQAIERLTNLGFDHQQAIQAYFVCDKNEELAANFLFDQPDQGDDDEAAPQ